MASLAGFELEIPRWRDRFRRRARRRPGWRGRVPRLRRPSATAVVRGVLLGFLVLGALSILTLAIEFAGNTVQQGPLVSLSPGSTHVILPGESLSGIAARHGISLDSLLAVGANRTRFPNPNVIRPGEFVELP